MKHVFLVGAVAGLALVMHDAPSNPAFAIQCQDEVQINKNSRVITPYCEAEYLAGVARSYGQKTSGRQIRANVRHMREVCEFVGNDIRVRAICQGLRLEGNGGFN